MKIAKYMETFKGYRYYRDDKGNIYTVINNQPYFCSNLKRGKLTEDKAEPYYPVTDIILAE